MNYSITDELEASKWATFYIDNCLNFSNDKRNKVLAKLNDFISSMENTNPYYNALPITGNHKYKNYKKGEINRFVKNVFGEKIYAQFDKELSITEAKETFPKSYDDNVVVSILREWVNLSESMKQESRIQANYKLDYLKFMRDCISHYGLYPVTRFRPDQYFKKYCLRVKGKNFVEYRFLCEEKEVLGEFVNNYLAGETIITNGRVINISDIEQINIYSTKLNKSELQLLSNKYGIRWSPLNPLHNIDPLLSKMEDVTNDFINSKRKRSLASNISEIASIETEEKIILNYSDVVSLISLIQERKTLQLSEDQFNDYLTDLLRAKGYNVSDQTRSGKSSTEKQAGELDIVIRDQNGNVSIIIETFILKSCGKRCPIARDHINKLINFYNANGIRNLFAIVICKGKDFSMICKNYYELLCDPEFDFENNPREIGLTNTKIINSKRKENGLNIELISVLSNFN
ncbi:hypothetical protein [Phaeodactylibacter xiamenensis]|mgnify:CR=1 FL=1|uniref:hypothetical protein n=1 Tax=Phaeodactylibacter xiamenensis TaxID=1524460 RepID=UPI003BAA7556